MTAIETQPGRAVLRAAIAGNPNSGKTSVFNALTGANRKVGNYPGVTVERREGRVRCNEGDMTVVDLPGTYSLTARSADELVARNVMIHERPDVVVDVVDASNLERNLYLVIQLMEMELPLVIALNMIDVARRRGLVIDAHKMSAILGVPVTETIGNRGRGITDLVDVCRSVAQQREPVTVRRVTYGHGVDEEVDALTAVVAGDPGIAARYPARWVAVKLIEKDEEIAAAVRRHARDAGAIERSAAESVNAIERHFDEPAEEVVAEARYGFASGVIRECVTHQDLSRRRMTDRIDAVVCHRLLGPLILAGVVYALFVAVFKIADEWRWMFRRSPTEVVGAIFAWLATATRGIESTSPMLHSLWTDGIIGGVGGIMSFVPLILVMFAFICVLEDTGYMARVAFVLDRALKVFGLQGKSIIAMIVSGGLGGGGCAVPGVMSTRVLADREDRLVTMLVAPLMNCGAKLPVYLMLVAAFFPRAQARMMFLLWILSWALALCSAWIIRRFVVKGEPTPFVMELPTYHVPTLRGVWRHTWNRTWMFVKKAGTLILATSILLWAAMYFPQLDTTAYDARIGALRAGTDDAGSLTAQGQAPARTADTSDADRELTRKRRAAQLRHSLAGRAGSALEGVSRWAGFDWRDNIALIGGFAAKEVVVGTLGVAYAMGDVDPGDSESLPDRLAADAGWSPLKALAMMVFVMIYAPCVTVQIMTWRESGHWKWPLFSMGYTVALAFVLAVAIYQIGLAAARVA